MSTATLERPKTTPISRMSWDDLLEAYTRCGNDYAAKREYDQEMRRRIRLGWQGNERYAPLRLFTSR
jgi:hypothetical protein